MGKWEYHRTQLGLCLGGTFYPNRRYLISMPQCKQKSLNTINIYRKQQQIKSGTGEDRVVHVVGEHKWVPVLTVSSPVLYSLIIPDHERRALFAIKSPLWKSLSVQ